MALPKEHQFEIMYGWGSQNGFKFGIGCPISVEDGGFHPGEPGWITQDAVNHRRGNSLFGKDSRASMTWTWDAFTNMDDPAGALEQIDQLAAGWGMESVFTDPLEYQRLRYTIGGRTRCIFGRPRKMSSPPTNLILNGMVPVSLEFVTVDGHTYDEEEQWVDVNYSSSSDNGGWTLPTTFPVETLPSDGEGAGTFFVGGNSRTYPIIRFHGPWTNPEITTGSGWRVKLSGSIALGDWIEIDTRPWRLTVKNRAGMNAAHMVDSRIWLEDCWLHPQSNASVRLGGTSANGDAKCAIGWRNTWSTW